jgi:hypothetical protein
MGTNPQRGIGHQIAPSLKYTNAFTKPIDVNQPYVRAEESNVHVHRSRRGAASLGYRYKRYKIRCARKVFVKSE